MKKRLVVFITFFVIVGIMIAGLLDGGALSYLRFQGGGTFSGILAYITAIFSGTLTIAFTRGKKHLDLEEKKRRLFHNFLAKYLLTNYIFVLFWIILTYLQPPIDFLFAETYLIAITLFTILFFSYLLSHLIILKTYRKNTDGYTPLYYDEQKGKDFKPIRFIISVVVISIILIIGSKFTIELINNVKMKNRINFKDGDIVSIEGSMTCITDEMGGKKAFSPRAAEASQGAWLSQSCYVDAFSFDTELHNIYEYDRFRFLRVYLNYNGEHWTTERNKPFTVTGTFSWRPDYKHRIIGEIDLISVVNKNGDDFLNDSEIITPIMNPIQDSFEDKYLLDGYYLFPAYYFAPIPRKSDADFFDTSGQYDYGEFSPTKETPSKDVKKIMYWPGKVNQHWDIDKQTWVSDPDGVSGSNISPFEYCKKWYPDFSGHLIGHALETIDTWEDVSGRLYTTTKVSIECI